MTSAPPRSLALERLAGFLACHDDQLSELSVPDVRRKYGDQRISAAWRVRVAPGQDDRLVDVLASFDYPFERPAIGIIDLPAEDRPRRGVYTNNTLCLDGPDDPLPVAADESMIVEVLARARTRMTSAPEAGDQADDAEFVEYWTAGQRAPKCISLLHARGPSREVMYTQYGGTAYIAEDKSQLVLWAENAGFSVPKNVRRTALIDMLRPPMGSITTNADLMEATTTLATPESVDLLKATALAVSVPVPVVLRVPTLDTHAFVAAWLDDPKVPRGKKQRVSTKWNGFSAARAPVAEIAKRFFVGGTTVQRGSVERVDPEWLFSRGGNILAPALLQSRVGIVGVGSLGSVIARRLAKAGVGALTLIDPDLLMWGNIARHELGGADVGRFKAGAMALRLRRDFPHMHIEAHSSRWEDVWRESPDALRDLDLIVSTIARAGPELHLNFIARTERFPRVLFGWLEDRASAGHALLVGAIGGCLGCGLNPFGQFEPRVVCHETGTIRRVAGCDEFYQPYTALEADATVAMITESVIDALISRTERSRLTTWVASKQTIVEDGGFIRDAWKRAYGELGDGRKRFSRDWNIVAGCPLCEGNA